MVVGIVYSVPLPRISGLLQSTKIENGKSYWNLPEYGEPLWLQGGAEALAYICNFYLKRQPKLTLLLPDYFCGQSLRYLRSMNVDLDFYPLTQTLTPDLGYLKQYQKKVDLFLLVHYFGKIVDRTNIIRFCHENNATLIEDCAHVLSPVVDRGWLGEYLIFSPRKQMAVKNGGVLYSRNEKFSGVHPKKSQWTWYLKQYLKFVAYTLLQPRFSTDSKIVWSGKSQAIQFNSPSKLDFRFLISAERYFDHEQLGRIRNYDYLVSILMRYENWCPLFGNEANSTAFFYLAMKCNTKRVASNYYSKLRYCGCPVLMWPDLPIEIRDKEAPEERVERIIFFSLLSQNDMAKYIKLVCRALS